MITVFGGTGFLGQHIVNTLVNHGHSVQVVARRGKSNSLPKGVNIIEADICDETSVIQAVQGATGLVNAVSLWVEKPGLSFTDVHVHGAERLARCAKQAGVKSLVHISGIGVSADSPSAFVRARAHGEQAVLKAFSHATIVRPSVVFGRNDAFLSGLKAATLMPIVPLFGKGQMRLQPVSVDDVATAVAKLLGEGGNSSSGIYELGGPRIYRYRELIELVLRLLNRRRLLIPVPFFIWRSLATMMGILPNPPLTPDQIRLLETDNTVSESSQGFEQLDIRPQSIDTFAEGGW